MPICAPTFGWLPQFQLVLAITASVMAQPAGDSDSLAADRGAPQDEAAATEFPPPSQSVRVGGDLEVAVTFENGVYRSGSCRIPTPLPLGYPPPTPPGAIELKSYPVVRRAEVDGAWAPDVGMNLTFWPLFQHISRRQIAMTSPVEVDYPGYEADDGKLPKQWTMAFLYRTLDDGPRGVDRSVRIIDAEPVTVVSLGFTGGTSFERVRDNLAALDRWLEARPQWERAGEPRALFYNGPEVSERNKWAEAQIPVRAVPAPAAEPPAEAGNEHPADPSPAQ